MNYSRPVHPAAYALVTGDTGGAADSANGSIPAFTPGHDNGALSGYGLMNQPCQRFSGGPQSSPTPSTTFVHVVFLLT